MAIEAEVVVEAEVEPGKGGELEATGELEVDVEPDMTAILGIQSNNIITPTVVGVLRDWPRSSASNLYI